MKYVYTPTRKVRVKKKKKTITSIGKNKEKLEPPCIANENVK